MDIPVDVIVDAVWRQGENNLGLHWSPQTVSRCRAGRRGSYQPLSE